MMIRPGREAIRFDQPPLSPPKPQTTVVKPLVEQNVSAINLAGPSMQARNPSFSAHAQMPRMQLH